MFTLMVTWLHPWHVDVAVCVVVACLDLRHIQLTNIKKQQRVSY